nr:4Fe-4S double cluster binding domain-containing protein [Entomospira culicis]
MGLFACHDNYQAAVRLAKELRKDLASLFNLPPKSFSIACNSRHLNEKKLAVDAGIGVYGKNSLVIVDGWGSFVVLLAVELPLYFLHLQPVNRVAERCLSCNLCQRACPPNALHHAYRLDRTLCLQSMASNGMLPVSDNLPVIYGCDICQNVCPYNKSALAYYKEAAAEATLEPWCDLALWERGDLADIQKAVKSSPLKFSWLDKEALMLNARVRAWSRAMRWAVQKELDSE